VTEFAAIVVISVAILTFESVLRLLSREQFDRSIHDADAAPTDQQPCERSQPATDQRKRLDGSDAGDEAKNHQDEVEKRVAAGLRCLRRNAGILTFFAAIIAATIYWRQLSVMHDQVDEMRDEQRPWVSITSGELSSFDFQENAPSVIEATAFFRLGINNTGATPALHIKAMGRLTTHADVVERSRAFCAEIDGMANKDMTAFPKEPGIKVLSSAGFDGTEQVSPGESILPHVAGCLSYKDSAGHLHHTGFAFDIFRRGLSTPDGTEELPITVQKAGAPAVSMGPSWSGFITFAD
jgi:hypothetical protein